MRVADKLKSKIENGIYFVEVSPTGYSRVMAYRGTNRHIQNITQPTLKVLQDILPRVYRLTKPSGQKLLGNVIKLSNYYTMYLPLS